MDRNLRTFPLPVEMIGDRIGHRLDPHLHAAYRMLAGDHGNPNLLTLLGFSAMMVASFFVFRGHWVASGLTILLSGVFDLFDGMVARRLGKATRFGGFLDSVVDRYSDLLFLLALIIHYLKQGTADLVILTVVVSIGTALVPYARARAEAAGVPCHAGLMERAERLILLAIGTLFNSMVPILWIMAVLTHFTVLQRIVHVWRRLRN